MHLSKDCNDVNLVRNQFGKLNDRAHALEHVIDPNSTEPHRV